MATKKFPPWPAEVIEGVAAVLGHTDYGLTGSEIGRMLAQMPIDDPVPGATKRHRLSAALMDYQAGTGYANGTIRFITIAMAPARYTGDRALFTRRQDDLNEQLVFVGLRVNDEGKLATGPIASTLDEAARHASGLRAELARRDTHEQVMAWCTIELLKKDAFHASSEAVKGVMQRLRTLSGRDGDTAVLVDDVLSLGQHNQPVLAINSLATITDRDEQKGFVNMLKGLSSMYRNPTAHDPRVLRNVTDAELLELLTTLSMVHRRLDSARRLR
jgi:uncharacterized protein (TIGR02391 family)